MPPRVLCSLRSHAPWKVLPGTTHRKEGEHLGGNKDNKKKAKKVDDKKGKK